ncbi:hypothetical protein [Agrilutibacter solisilvae]|uniref:Uncharacterized protein n=1 Tax=Agrilutibacter solisilvae TaxID=2763317 RepID=A0A974Y1H8_9GAMM|nr:hypothetical protein [Lysobacter solisilvae]QSX78675.1 hypothetical protein I8J32_001665 [Lysobacter solisilvae]
MAETRTLDPDALHARLEQFEQELPGLHARHPGTFAFANIWAERYEAILAQTPEHLKPSIERRLERIGIRWGVMPGVRVTRQMPSMPSVFLRRRSPFAIG